MALATKTRLRVKSSPFEKLRQRLNDIQDLRSVQGLLGWDAETYMPPGGIGVRAQQQATLSKLCHEMFTAPEVGEWIAQAQDAKVYNALDRVDQAMVREAARDYARETRLPSRLVQEMSEVTSAAHSVWVEARKNNDFAQFAPTLQKIVSLNQEMATAIGYENSPYNALLNLYEPDLTVSQLDPLFATIQPRLVALVQQVQQIPEAKLPKDDFLSKPFSATKQWEFTERVLGDMGFDFNHGRQDKAAHPFTMGMGCGDVRLTTRIFPRDFLSGLMSSMHEGGHGLYEQGIDASLSRTILDGGASLGIHESQSRLWENQVGRSKVFWAHYLPKLKAEFPKPLSGVGLETFYKAVNRVQPSLIRVEADEVTYNLHILLRYRLEKQIIEGKLAVKDIPEAWNTGMQDLLGVTPDSDANGCLQDVHWSHGSFGYFPTYTLGNVAAAQIFNAANAAIPDLEAQLRRGRLTVLTEWLNENVHRWSKVERPSEILQRVCGEGLNPEPLLSYLEAKVAEVYG